MKSEFNYKTENTTLAFSMDGYYLWDCSVIKKGNKYHMFSSRWKEEYGFGWNWLLNSEIIHSVSDTPQGPFKFHNVVLPHRGSKFFDGMSTHNTCIKSYNGKFYLYYMGTTYNSETLLKSSDISNNYGEEIWNRKRIGVAVADDINGEFIRCDEPILSPRDCSHWDCTVTTNPTVAIMPDGKTYLMYKSRSGYGKPLQLGVAVSEKPDGTFKRISEDPICLKGRKNKFIEDPFLWYNEKEDKFCIIAKDDYKDEKDSITGEWGAGFYAESQNCIDFELGVNPKVYSRKLKWKDGKVTTQCNLERASLLFDDNGEPDYIYFATGNGNCPYGFEGKTYIVSAKLVKKG